MVATSASTSLTKDPPVEEEVDTVDKAVVVVSFDLP